MSSDKSLQVLVEASARCRSRPQSSHASLLSKWEGLLAHTGLVRQLQIPVNMELGILSEQVADTRKTKKRPTPVSRGVASPRKFFAFGIPELSAQNQLLPDAQPLDDPLITLSIQAPEIL